jgi:hypothetical protein
MTERIRPSAVWYAVGGALMFVGVVAGLIVGIAGVADVLDAPDDFQRIDAPGQGIVTFDEPGGYVLYLEARGNVAPTGRLATDQVALIPDRENGRPLAMEPYDTQLTYERGNRAGRADLTFEVVEPGDYVLEVAEVPNRVTTVAVGESYASDLVAPILIALACGVGGLLVGGAVMLSTGIRRGRAKRQRRLQAWPQGPPGPPGSVA